MSIINKHPYWTGFVLIASLWAITGGYIVSRVTKPSAGADKKAK